MGSALTAVLHRLEQGCFSVLSHLDPRPSCPAASLTASCAASIPPAPVRTNSPVIMSRDDTRPHEMSRRLPAALYPSLRDRGSFGGRDPAQNPRFVLAVVQTSRKLRSFVLRLVSAGRDPPSFGGENGRPSIERTEQQLIVRSGAVIDGAFDDGSDRSREARRAPD
jgi:hypothetical protein